MKDCLALVMGVTDKSMLFYASALWLSPPTPNGGVQYETVMVVQNLQPQQNAIADGIGARLSSSGHQAACDPPRAPLKPSFYLTAQSYTGRIREPEVRADTRCLRQRIP